MDINVTIEYPDLPLAAAALAKAIFALSESSPAHPAFVSQDSAAPEAPNTVAAVNNAAPEIPVNPYPWDADGKLPCGRRTHCPPLQLRPECPFGCVHYVGPGGNEGKG